VSRLPTLAIAALLIREKFQTGARLLRDRRPRRANGRSC